MGDIKIKGVWKYINISSSVFPGSKQVSERGTTQVGCEGCHGLVSKSEEQGGALQLERGANLALVMGLAHHTVWACYVCCAQVGPG